MDRRSSQIIEEVQTKKEGRNKNSKDSIVTIGRKELEKRSQSKVVNE